MCFNNIPKSTFMTMSKIFPLAGLVVAFGIAGVSAEEGFKYDSKSRRDPFVPLISETGGYASDAYEASAAEDIRLEGIVWDEGKGSIAIINGEIVKEGELIGSIKILKINKESVTFDINGEHINMELNKE
ncbi:MAG: hypothetical protein WC312_04110 [Candidatus Omnitrophota bacterium]